MSASNLDIADSALAVSVRYLQRLTEQEAAVVRERIRRRLDAATDPAVASYWRAALALASPRPQPGDAA